MKKKVGKNDTFRVKVLLACELCLALVLGTLAILAAFGVAPWQHYAVEILGVTATDMDGDIVKPGSHFLVTTNHGSVDGLRQSIYLEPAIDYEIVEKTPGSEYEIVPTSELTDNTIFNVDSVSNEVIAYKWAFQTKKDLSVSKVYPANGANYVSAFSVIEFSFSYPDVEDVESHFSIKPQIEGKLEKDGRVWRFTPSSQLSPNTTYEITIKAGLTYGEETMAKDFHSSFSTYERSVVSSDTVIKGITLDGVSTFTESETPVIVYDGNNDQYYNEATSIDIERIATADDYIKYLKDGQVEGEIIGNYSFEKKSDNPGYGKLSILNQTLPTGYYIFHFKSSTGQNLYKANVEVNNLAAYAIESERDVIVWVAENGDFKADTKVSFKGHDFKTGESGLLKITDISDFSEKNDYLKIGDSEQPLVIALTNFKNDIYPYGFIYTDRLLYKPTDTIKVWGYVPLQFFKDAPKRDNFSVIVFNDIKKTITVDEDGFFALDISLDNYKDKAYGDIILQYNDAQLAYRYVSVENYTLENYTYELIADKNYVIAGEVLSFKVKVNHITGFPAANKDIIVTYDDHDYYGSTNAMGEADFNIQTAAEAATVESSLNYTSRYLEIRSGGAEYNKYSNGVTIWVFKNGLNISSSNNSEDGTVTFDVDVLDLSKKVKTTPAFQNLVQGKYNGSATITFYEERTERHVAGYYYNTYLKELAPTYSWTSSASVVDTVSVNFENGRVIYEYPTDFKEPETDVRYSYYAVLSASDSGGRLAYSYKNTYYANSFLGEKTTSYGSYAIEAYNNKPNGLGWQYNLYRFELKEIADSSSSAYGYLPKEYSIGDHLSLKLYNYSREKVENQGSILAVAYQESIVKAQVFTDDNLDLEFDQSMYPGAEVAGAYFINGRFYRIAPSFRDYKTTDSELNVVIETDRSSYEPGDTVKAKVIVTRPDGSRAGGKVNLSVVNEAIFSEMDDDTSILDSIYYDKYYHSYSMSTYQDYELYGGGGRGAAGGGRADFGDTLFFGSKTLSNGEAEFEFKLNDSITSFRLTALTVENGTVINAGAGTSNVVSVLPLAISTVMPKKVKNTDDLVLNASSIVSADGQIDYSFYIKELDKTLTASGLPGKSVSVNFGKLELGQYTVTISARDSAGNEDKMIYPLEIIETAQEIAVKKTVELSRNSEITPSKNPIIVEVYNKDTRAYLSYLSFLEANRTMRLDTLVGYYKSLEFQDKYYHEDASARTPSLNGYMSSGYMLKQLENAEGDYVLTALVNFFAPDYFELKASNYVPNLKDDVSVVIQKLLVLASFKESVLLDLKAASNLDNLSEEDFANLALAFAMLGDYDTAKNIYQDLSDDEDDASVLAVLATMIDKDNASWRIDSIINSEPATEYLPFAIISFFVNNEVELSSKDKVKITVNNESEEFEITPLNIERRVYYSNDLASLKFESGSNDLLATYYYQGAIAELGDDFETDIRISLESTPVVGKNVNLIVDISNLQGEERNGEFSIALPTSLKFSATFSGKNGVYLIRNNNEYIKLSLSEYYDENTIKIPLYVSAQGNYEFEPVIFTHKDNYHLSNKLTVNI